MAGVTFCYNAFTFHYELIITPKWRSQAFFVCPFTFHYELIITSHASNKKVCKVIYISL